MSIARYEADPMAFFKDLRIPSATGPRRFEEVMVDFQRERFEALGPALLAVAKRQAAKVTRHFWDGTKGTAKDYQLAMAMLWLAAFAQYPLVCQVAAVDGGQAGELAKAARDLLHLSPWLGKRVEVQRNRIVCSATGVEIEIIPCDTAGSHGARPDVLIVNELSHIQKWEFVENLLDNSAKVPWNVTIIASNAGFLESPAWRWREMARLSDRWYFHQYAAPAPWITAEELAEAEKRNSRQRFLRLFHGIWSDGSGDAIDFSDVSACCTLEGPHREPKKGMVYVGGLDLGIRRDHSAFVLVGKDCKTSRTELAWCESWRPKDGVTMPLQPIADAVLELHERFKPVTINYDEYQAALMAEQLRAKRVRMNSVTFAGRNLNDMATGLMEVFRERSIALYNDDLLIKDLRKLVIVEGTRFGHKLESTRDSEGGHADRATALSLALLAARDVKPPRKSSVIIVSAPSGHDDDEGTPISSWSDRRAAQW